MPIFEMSDNHGIRANRIYSIGFDMESMDIHNSFEIWMALSSGVHCFVNDAVYPINPGDVMLFTNMDLHRFSVPPNAPYERYVITFSTDLLPSGQEYSGILDCFSRGHLSGRKLSLSEDERGQFIALADAINEEREMSSYAQLGQRLALCRLLLFINRIQRKALPSLPSDASPIHPQIRAVIDYIDRHYNQALTLEELTAICHFNKYYLCRLFRQETGFRMRDYIIYRRISQAAEFLRKGDSVSEVSQKTGFSSTTFFITTFKKNVGITPYQYALSWRRLED